MAAMTDQPTLFDVDDPDPGKVVQMCSFGPCIVTAWASDDGLRARGWLVYDGESMTGQPLHVRLCPSCQRKLKKEMARINQLRPWPEPSPLPLEPADAPPA